MNGSATTLVDVWRPFPVTSFTPPVVRSASGTSAFTDHGLIIDTPGIRSFGLAHVDLDRLIHAFPDLRAASDNCPRGCSHDEEHCALDTDPDVNPARVSSLRRVLRSRAEGESRN